MTKDEALKLALEALEDLGMKHFENTGEVLYKETFAIIKETLAQPEQEPVAWVSSEELLVMRGNALGGAKDWRINVGLVKQENDVGLYTTPPQRTWVGLTDEEIKAMYIEKNWYEMAHAFTWGAAEVVARAIEAAHGIKGEA